MYRQFCRRLFQSFHVKVFFTFTCLALLMALPFSASADEDSVPESVDLDGVEKLIEDERGNVVILNFWATWCAPCRAEIRDLVKIRHDYSPDRVSIIGISFDFNPQAVPPFMERKEMNYPVYISSQKVMDALNITGIPYTLIYDCEGNLAHVHDKLVDYETLQEELDQLLAD